MKNNDALRLGWGVSGFPTEEEAEYHRKECIRFLESKRGDLCDHCGRTGVQIVRVDAGKTICEDCEKVS